MTRFRSMAGGLMALVTSTLAPLPALAQGDSLQQFDPSDVFFQGWLVVRDAESAQNNGNFLDAFWKYDKARKLFDSVALYHPQWKEHLVKARQDSCRESMEAIRDKALAEQQAADQKVEELVEGSAVPSPQEPSALDVPSTPAEPPAAVASLQRKIGALEGELRTRNARDAEAAGLRRQLAALQAERAALSRAPIDAEMKSLNDSISKLSTERNALSQALQKSRTEHQDALAELASLRADTDAALRKRAELEQNLATERKVSNEVVAGLRKQLGELKETLKDKDEMLGQANVRAALLERQLTESRAEIADLRDERDRLLKEREEMTALLKLNESERVQALIEQNMELGRELKHAQDRLAAVAADNDSTKDDLLAAKRDLAYAKGRIIELQRETAGQRERLTDLEARLANAGKELTSQAASPQTNRQAREEIDMLRGIIERQLKIQQRRRQAKDLLLAEVQRVGVEDDAFMGALGMFAGQELTLTDEENQMLTDRVIDDEFIFSDHPSDEERSVAGQELQERIGFKTGLARRAFARGRYLIAREFFESILDDHPGHVPSMLNLGVVHLRSDDPAMAVQAFENSLAIRTDQPLPYAHFMLGVSFYRMQDYLRSKGHLDTSLGLEPDNAKAHVFLGSIAGLRPDFAAAVHHFEEAIKIDPTLTEPFYNLAVIRAEQGRMKEALQYYRSAVENGAHPDLRFEERISQ